MSALPVPEDERTRLHGPAYEWPLWASTIRVVTADPHALPSARRLIEAELAHVELVASQFRRDSELSTLPSGRRARISTTLAAILSAALEAARETDGAVDPTLGHAIHAVPVDTPHGDRPVPFDAVPVDRWRRIELDEAAQMVLVPRGVQLDLEPITTAWAVDRCVATVADVLGVAVLVSLGGSIATAGPGGSGAWEILVGGRPDHPADPAALVAVPTGLAVATAVAMAVDPVLNPSAGPFGDRQPDRQPRSEKRNLSVRIPTAGPWSSATVVAPDCVTAVVWSTAALARGAQATDMLEQQGLPGRLVGVDGRVRHLVGWPEDAEMKAS